MVSQDNQSIPPLEDENAKLQQLAEKMVDKLKHLHYQYPDVSDSLHTIKQQISAKMQSLQNILVHLPEKDRDLFTLLVIHQIHNLVDEIFQIAEEAD